MKNTDELKELVFWLEPIHEDGYTRCRTQTIWAATPEEGEKRLLAWSAWNLRPKYLYTMDEFRERCAREAARDSRTIKQAETKGVEVENV